MLLVKFKSIAILAILLFLVILVTFLAVDLLSAKWSPLRRVSKVLEYALLTTGMIALVCSVIILVIGVLKSWDDIIGPLIN